MVSESFLSFEEIGNNQIKIEGKILYRLNGKPTFRQTWEYHKLLFEKIENLCPGIDTYLEIFYAILYIDWYNNIIYYKPNDKHYFEKVIKKIDTFKMNLELYTTEPIRIDYPLHQNRVILDLKEYLTDNKVENNTIHNIIEIIKNEFYIQKINQTSRDKQIKQFHDFMNIIETMNSKQDNVAIKQSIDLYKKKYKK